MSKILVLYSSRYGAAKQYAQWLAEALDADCMEIKKAASAAFSKYSAVLFGGGVYASGIEGLPKFRALLPRIGAVPAAVFAVGMSPEEDTVAVRAVKERNMTENLSLLPFFYCRGKMDMAKLKFLHRTLLSVMRKSFLKKDAKDLSPSERAVVEAGEKPRDWSDRKYLAPVLEWVQSVLPEEETHG